VKRVIPVVYGVPCEINSCNIKIIIISFSWIDVEVQKRLIDMGHIMNWLHVVVEFNYCSSLSIKVGELSCTIGFFIVTSLLSVLLDESRWNRFHNNDNVNTDISFFFVTRIISEFNGEVVGTFINILS